MSNVCCKEFSGWFKSFTKLERALALLEAILLVVLVVLLILLILHLVVCATSGDRAAGVPRTTTPADEGQAHNTTSEHTSIDDLPYLTPTTDAKPVNNSEPFQTTKSDSETETNGSPAHSSPAPGDKSKKFTVPDVQCSWTPSAQTTAVVHYYEHGATDQSVSTHSPAQSSITNVIVSSHVTGDVQLPSTNTTVDGSELEADTTTQEVDYLEELIQADQSDGEKAEDEFKNYVVALVKLKPPKDVIFGCILTIISEYWTLTAASCIEAIEEVDSLDSFVIMEQYGSDSRGPLQTIEDVQIHPLYEGRNRSYDLAALRSGRSLTRRQGTAVKLASLLDYALMTIGERFTILGYGAFRSIDSRPNGRSLRQAAVYRLPARQCAADGQAALRHLLPGRAVPGAACGTGPLCCGALFSRGLPCNYCSGTPLVRGAVLLAVMAENRQCGVACEPQIYVNIAALADWIGATVASLNSNTK